MSEETLQLFKEACDYLGYNAETVLPDVSCMPFKHRKSATAYHMLVIIIEAAQKKANWQADYHAGNRKYWTLHEVKASKKQPAGFGFSYSIFLCDGTHSAVGSRLCFPDAETEREYAPKLEELYIDFKL